MTHIKTGVDLTNMHPEMVRGIAVVAYCFDRIRRDCVITSGRDGEHMETSLHYQGKAADFRTHHLRQEDQTVLLNLVSGELGKDFDVCNEPTHLHVEYDPRR